MKISRLPTIYKDIKPLLSGICNEAKSLLALRKTKNDDMQLIRDAYTSEKNDKTSAHTSGKVANTTIVDNYFANLLSTYFIFYSYIDTNTNINNTFAYIRAKDITGNPDLKYKISINFMESIYKNYNVWLTGTTETADKISAYYTTHILNDLTYQFDLLDFYPVQTPGDQTHPPGKYSSTFYTLSWQVYEQIESIPKYTYMLSGYNNNIVPTSSDVISSMPNYNSLSTNYPTNLDLDIKNKLNLKRNELNGLINKLRYDKSYNYKEILTIKKLKSEEFADFKDEAQEYNHLLSAIMSSVYMTWLNMQSLMTWLDYILSPNENTIWRTDVINNVSSYITNVYPPVSGGLYSDGSYGENFEYKANFNLIFNM